MIKIWDDFEYEPLFESEIPESVRDKLLDNIKYMDKMQDFLKLHNRTEKDFEWLKYDKNGETRYGFIVFNKKNNEYRFIAMSIPKT